MSDNRAAVTPMNVDDLPAWLVGRWTLRRAVNGDEGTFVGEAEFRADRTGGVVWHERGRLRIAASAHDMPARRTLRIVPGDDGRWQVCFEDGRPFHVLDLRRGRDDAEHLCGADVYRGRFVVDDADAFSIRWRVDGPRKADVICSVYRRLLEASG